jgi:hypothetical protein
VTATRSARRIGAAALVIALAAAGAFALIALLSSRDSSTFSIPAGPGQQFADLGNRQLASGTPDPRYASDPPTSGPHVAAPVRADDEPLSADQLLTALADGDIVLVFSDPRQAAALRALADGVAGPFDPSVAAAGQAVILDPKPAASAIGAATVTAVAWRHMLRAAAPSDPALRAFVSFWLGRGAGG